MQREGEPMQVATFVERCKAPPLEQTISIHQVRIVWAFEVCGQGGTSADHEAPVASASAGFGNYGGELGVITHVNH